MSLTTSLVRTAALVGYEILKAETVRVVEAERSQFSKTVGVQGVKFVSIWLLKDLMNLLGFAALIGISLFVTSLGLQNSALERGALWLTSLAFGLYFLLAALIYSRFSRRDQ
jgi:hypothetical protein